MNWNIRKFEVEKSTLTLKVRKDAGFYTNKEKPSWVTKNHIQAPISTFLIIIEGLPEAMKERNLELADVTLFVNTEDTERYTKLANDYLNELKQICVAEPTITFTKENAEEIIQSLAYGRQRLEESSNICIGTSDMQKLRSIQVYQELVFDVLEGHGYDLGTLMPKCYETMVIPYHFYDEPQEYRKKEWDDDLSIPLGLPEGLWSYCSHSKKVMEEEHFIKSNQFEETDFVLRKDLEDHTIKFDKATRYWYLDGMLIDFDTAKSILNK